MIYLTSTTLSLSWRNSSTGGCQPNHYLLLARRIIHWELNRLRQCERSSSSPWWMSLLWAGFYGEHHSSLSFRSTSSTSTTTKETWNWIILITNLNLLILSWFYSNCTSSLNDPTLVSSILGFAIPREISWGFEPLDSGSKHPETTPSGVLLVVLLHDHASGINVNEGHEDHARGSVGVE